MANTYLKIYLHIVFAVKNRASAIAPWHQANIHNYIAGIVRNCGHYPIAVGGTDNHVHILVSYENLAQPIPELVRSVKSSSSARINGDMMCKCRFAWQRGYACMSYSHSQIADIKRYIERQDIHHHSMTLEEEIRKMLDLYDIPYDPRYIIRQEE